MSGQDRSGTSRDPNADPEGTISNRISDTDAHTVGSPSACLAICSHFHSLVQLIHSDNPNADGLCRDTQFGIQRGNRKCAPLGELKVGSII